MLGNSADWSKYKYILTHITRDYTAYILVDQPYTGWQSLSTAASRDRLRLSPAARPQYSPAARSRAAAFSSSLGWV